MPNPVEKINVNIVMDKDLKFKFEKLYTKQLMKIFIVRSIERAIISKDFFDDVFFNTSYQNY